MYVFASNTRSMLGTLLALFQLQGSHVEKGLDLREAAVMWKEY